MRRALLVLATIGAIAAFTSGTLSARAQEDPTTTTAKPTTTTAKPTTTTTVARATTTTARATTSTTPTTQATTTGPSVNLGRTTTTGDESTTTSTSLATKDASSGVNGGAVALLIFLIAAVGGVAIWVFTRMRSA